jgi:hypothetical protein
LQTICLKCGRLDISCKAGRVECPNCGFKITQRRYAKLMGQGSEIVLYGFRYRIEYEAQVAKHGKIVRKYSLREPTFVESAIAVMVSGIAGNAAYDVVMNALKFIYTQLNRRRLKPRTISSDRGPCAEDVDLVHKLIGNDPEFAKDFIGYTADYASGKETANRHVVNALKEEYAIDRLSEFCKNDPSIFVFASGTGKRFHRRNCKLLRPPTRKIRIKAAYLTQLTPCQKCKPI